MVLVRAMAERATRETRIPNRAFSGEMITNCLLIFANFSLRGPEGPTPKIHAIEY